MASNNLIGVSISPSRSVNFKTIMVLFLVSGFGSSANSRISTRPPMWAHDHRSSGSLASSRELCHRISTRPSMWVNDHRSSGSLASSRELCHRISTRPSMWVNDHRSSGSSASSRELYHRISTRQSMWVNDHRSSGSLASSRELCHRISTRPSMWVNDHRSSGSSASSRELYHRISTRQSMWVNNHRSSGSLASSRELCHRISTRLSMWVNDHRSSGSLAFSRGLCHRISTSPSMWVRDQWSTGFSASSRVLPQNFNKAFKCELMITGVQQLEDSFSIARTSFRAWFSISWGLGQEAWLEQCKLRRCQSGDNRMFLNLWEYILTYLSKDVFIWRRRWRRYRVVLHYSWFRRRRQPQKFRSLPSQFQARVRPHSGRLPSILFHHPRKRAASSTLDTSSTHSYSLLSYFPFFTLWFLTLVS